MEPEHSRPGATQRVRVREITDAGTSARPDRLATEEPLEIRLESPGQPARRVWVTMRTPGRDFDLAVGWLRHEGIIDRPTAVGYCTDADLTPEQKYNVVTVVLDAPPLRAPDHRHDGLSAGSSACGVCGHNSIASALSIRPCTPHADRTPSDNLVRELPGLLREHQSVFARTGGVHAAGLFDEHGAALTVREDVGRHNAVDKVTGARVLAGSDPAGTYLVVSGRAGFELVQKALAVGTSALVSFGAPTSLSVSLAREGGLALYGFTSERRSVRYS